MRMMGGRGWRSWCACSPSSEDGTYKTVKARFWPGLSGKRPQHLSSCTPVKSTPFSVVPSAILHKKIIKFNFFNNKVQYTYYSILLVKNMLCRKLHCQKGSNSIPFSHKIKAVVPWRHDGRAGVVQRMCTTTDHSKNSSTESCTVRYSSRSKNIFFAVVLRRARI